MSVCLCGVDGVHGWVFVAFYIPMSITKGRVDRKGLWLNIASTDRFYRTQIWSTGSRVELAPTEKQFGLQDRE